jgi:hypothetical protein
MKNLFSTFLIILMITATSSCGSISPAARTAKYQEPREYAFWERSQLTAWQKVFGKKSKDVRVIQAEVEVANSIWAKEKKKEEDKILKKVESIKSKIQ